MKTSTSGDGIVAGDFVENPVTAGGLALSRFTASAALLILIAPCLLIFPQRVARDALQLRE